MFEMIKKETKELVDIIRVIRFTPKLLGRLKKATGDIKTKKC
jgi:hypothetical protein